jgi:hypothetical protein
MRSLFCLLYSSFLFYLLRSLFSSSPRFSSSTSLVFCSFVFFLFLSYLLCFFSPFVAFSLFCPPFSYLLVLPPFIRYLIYSFSLLVSFPVTFLFYFLFICFFTSSSLPFCLSLHKLPLCFHTTTHHPCLVCMQVMGSEYKIDISPDIMQ